MMEEPCEHINDLIQEIARRRMVIDPMNGGELRIYCEACDHWFFDLVISRLQGDLRKW